MLIWFYKFKRIVGKSFIMIIKHYKRVGHSINIMGQSALPSRLLFIAMVFSLIAQLSVRPQTQ